MSGKLRSLFTDEEIRYALDVSLDNYAETAELLSKAYEVKVTRQNVQYWAKQLGAVPVVADRPKILVFDIETAPITQYIWSYWQKFHQKEMTVSDWYCLSYAAKWYGEDEVFYEDLRGIVEAEDDTTILAGIHKLLCEADVVITQNGNSFDIKKLNARFLIQGFDKPTPFKKIDTLLIAKKEFGFTSNKLDYMTDTLNTKYKKLKHGKFPGFELWKECLDRNPEAWDEMEEYNRHDTLALEELYKILIPWDNNINFNLYHDEVDHICKCGGISFMKNGFYYTAASKFQKFRCKGCGAETRDKTNLFDKWKRKSLRQYPPRN